MVSLLFAVCIIQSVWAEVPSNVQIQVDTNNDVHSINSGQYFTVAANKTATLECMATGGVQYEFMKDGEVSGGRDYLMDSQFDVTNFGVGSVASYSCQAEDLTNPTPIESTETPPFKILALATGTQINDVKVALKSGSAANTAAGGTVGLTCTGSGAAKFLFVKRRGTGTRGRPTIVREFDAAPDYENTDFQATDAGSYGCVAIHSDGGVGFSDPSADVILTLGKNVDYRSTFSANHISPPNRTSYSATTASGTTDDGPQQTGSQTTDYVSQTTTRGSGGNTGGGSAARNRSAGVKCNWTVIVAATLVTVAVSRG